LALGEGRPRWSAKVELLALGKRETPGTGDVKQKPYDSGRGAVGFLYCLSLEAHLPVQRSKEPLQTTVAKRVDKTPYSIGQLEEGLHQAISRCLMHRKCWKPKPVTGCLFFYLLPTCKYSVGALEDFSIGRELNKLLLKTQFYVIS
jgi:hypothetical protein